MSFGEMCIGLLATAAIGCIPIGLAVYLAVGITLTIMGGRQNKMNITFIWLHYTVYCVLTLLNTRVPTCVLSNFNNEN